MENKIIFGGNVKLARDEPVWTEQEIAEAQASLDRMEILKEKRKSAIEKETLRIAKIKQPDIELTSRVEQVIYYLDSGDGEFSNRVTRGMLCELWSMREWYQCIEDCVIIKCKELGEPYAPYIAMVENYYMMSQRERDKLYFGSTEGEEVSFLRKELYNIEYKELKEHKRR